MMGLLERWRARRSARICQEAHARIQEIVDGEVPDEKTRRRLEHHVDACHPCAAEADSVREIKDALRRVGSEPDPAIRQRLQSLLDDIRSGDVPAEEADGPGA